MKYDATAQFIEEAIKLSPYPRSATMVAVFPIGDAWRAVLFGDNQPLPFAAQNGLSIQGACKGLSSQMQEMRSAKKEVPHGEPAR